ncbi:ABC transporter ATP-binding protein [Myxococcota bacterium]|nr:ABC transporter ATP-binding protein [Myxococcota bacterium]MBU1430461.1 ABC transporter ATP-binding protein [Myxococcota bacterium]MBU1898670.1 ABC transporter ATP-binding protein [Myxococcota bacterium]
MSDAPLLSARGVSKMFGQIRALNEIDLDIGPGVTGLLGPNGSGKSTLLKLFAGQLIPDTGEVRLMGQDPFRQPAALRHLGLCPEQDRFYEEISARRFVTVLTQLHGYDHAAAQRMADEAIARVGMSETARRPLGQMSRGMRQRIKIAQAIAHNPPVLLLDEPLTGADPVARADLIDLVRDLGREERAVVVSSHVLHEVEAMTHDVIFIRFGRLRAQGDVLRLRAMLADRPYRIRLEVDAPRQVAALLLEAPYLRAVTLLSEDTLEITTTDLEAAAAEIPLRLLEAGHALRRFTSPDADLESLYRYLMGHPQAQGGA